jgi:hypothetical protein
MTDYRTQADDTSPEIEELVVAGWRRMTPAEKFRLVNELTSTARKLSLAGIRSRHPGASERELRLRLASFWLDRETMVRLFDWDPEIHGVG